MTSINRIAIDIDKYVVALGNDSGCVASTSCFKEVVMQIDGVPTDTAFLAKVSAHGAKLLVATNTEVPTVFDLLGFYEGKAVQCEVIWQREDELGIRFINAIDLSDQFSAKWAA
jgi:hypothetical protein